MLAEEQQISNAERNLLILWAVGWVVVVAITVTRADPLVAILVCILCQPQRLVRNSYGPEEHFSPPEIITITTHIISWLYVTLTLMTRINVVAGAIVCMIGVPRKIYPLGERQTDPTTTTATTTETTESV